MIDPRPTYVAEDAVLTLIPKCCARPDFHVGFGFVAEFKYWEDGGEAVAGTSLLLTRRPSATHNHGAG